MKVYETNLNWRGPFGRRMGAPPGVVWHNAAASNCTIQDVHRWHLARRWLGCAYHYFIDKEGKIWRGRPEWAIGGHTWKHGTWIGVCCEGNYDKEQMPDVQLQACLSMERYLTGKYGRSFRTKGHRELPGNATSCPGKNFPLDKIKDAGKPLEVSIVPLKKLMLAYAKKQELKIPDDFAINEEWGPGAQTLAWRVSGHLKIKQTSHPTPELSIALLRRG